MGLRADHAADTSAHKLRTSDRHYGKNRGGKSSLCNALFAGEVSPVSDVAACTREPLRFRLQVGDRHMTLVDLPGVGESGARDNEYAALYREQLPGLTWCCG
jgi:predicted GTPase